MNLFASNTFALNAPITPTSMPPIAGSTARISTCAPGVSATSSADPSPTIAVFAFVRPGEKSEADAGAPASPFRLLFYEAVFSWTDQG